MAVAKPITLLDVSAIDARTSDKDSTTIVM